MSTETAGREPGETLLRYLPAIFRGAPDLRELLGAFEEVLVGPGADGTPGLEQEIAALPRLLDAGALYLGGDEERREFLPWLAHWVALGDLPGLSREQLSRLIPRVVPLYASRGTGGHLRALLELLLPEVTAEVDDRELPTLAVGESRVGRETRLGGDLPFCFLVRLRPRGVPPQPDPAQRARVTALAQRVIDWAKPACTAHRLEWAEATDSTGGRFEAAAGGGLR